MIYFIQDDGLGLIKIGYTASQSADGRLSDHQTGNGCGLTVLATMPGEKKDEAALHQRFAALRERGEWFRPLPPLIQFIVASQQPVPKAPEAASPADAAHHFWFGTCQEDEHRIRRVSDVFVWACGRLGWRPYDVYFKRLQMLVDHEGQLEAFWNGDPTAEEKAAIADAWEVAGGEDRRNVTHRTEPK